MSKNLYDVLGIKPDASSKDIKRAYRKHAMRKHPDRGGDGKEFQALQKAYDVLGDPGRRHQYDTTGTVDQQVESRTERARRMMCMLIVHSAEAIASLADPKKESPLELAVNTLNEESKSIGSELKNARLLAERLRMVQERMTRKDGGENQAGLAIQSRVEKEEAKIKAIEARMLEIGDIKLELELYSYRLEKQEEMIIASPLGEVWNFVNTTTSV